MKTSRVYEDPKSNCLLWAIQNRKRLKGKLVIIKYAFPFPHIGLLLNEKEIRSFMAYQVNPPGSRLWYRGYEHVWGSSLKGVHS